MGISCESSHLTGIFKTIESIFLSIIYPQSIHIPPPTSSPPLILTYACKPTHLPTHHLLPLLLPLPLPSDPPQPHPLPLPTPPHLPNTPPPLPLHQPNHAPIPPPPALKTKPTHRLLPNQCSHRIQQLRKSRLKIRAIGSEEDVWVGGDGWGKW